MTFTSIEIIPMHQMGFLSTAVAKRIFLQTERNRITRIREEKIILCNFNNNIALILRTIWQNLLCICLFNDLCKVDEEYIFIAAA